MTEEVPSQLTDDGSLGILKRYEYYVQVYISTFYVLVYSTILTYNYNVYPHAQSTCATNRVNLFRLDNLQYHLIFSLNKPKCGHHVFVHAVEMKLVFMHLAVVYAHVFLLLAFLLYIVQNDFIITENKSYSLKK